MSRLFMVSKSDFASRIPYAVVREKQGAKRGGPASYAIRLLPRDTYSIRSIAERMACEGVPLKASVIHLVLCEFVNCIDTLISEGNVVELGDTCRFVPQISGSFPSHEAARTAARKTDEVKACATFSTSLRLGLTCVNRRRIPEILQVVDMATSRPDAITDQGCILVNGGRLTWDTEADDEGWFLLCDGAESKCTVIGETQDATSAVLGAEDGSVFSGEALELVLRTRSVDGELLEFPYENALEPLPKF